MSFLDLVLKRRSHYRQTFLNTKSGAFVLADLRRFCRAMSTPLVVSPQSGMTDPIATGVAIGRAEVFNRIVAHLHLDDAQLMKLKEDASNE